MPTQSDVLEGSYFTVASGSGLSREGFTVYGWSNGASIYTPGSGYTVTSDVTLTAVWRANAPTSAPTVTEKTDAKITVSAVAGYEYSKNNGASWQASNTFTGLSAGTTYSIRTRVAASGDDLASNLSPLLQVTTKTAPAAPVAPTVISRTDTSIEVNVLSGQVYAIKSASDSDYGSWQTSGLFTGLASDAVYDIVARTSETDMAMPSLISAALESNTKTAPAAAPAAPAVKVRTDASIEIEAVSSLEYAIKFGTAPDYGAWQISGLFTGLTAGTAYHIAARVPGTETAMPSLISAALET